MKRRLSLWISKVMLVLMSHILGALFITSIASASFSRVNIPEESRVPFMVYMDEFHNFTTLSLVNMFSELRKFKVGMTFGSPIYANNWMMILNLLSLVMPERLYLLGLAQKMQCRCQRNVSWIWCEDFINLQNYKIYLKLMIDGKPSRPFSAYSVLNDNLYNFYNKLNFNRLKKYCWANA